jgi:hypothetical protein
MRPNILPGNVRNEVSVSVLFAVQYQGSLFALVLRSKPPAPEEQAEFQRHIKTRKICDRVERDGGKVIDSEPTLLDHPLDLGEAEISGIVLL